MFQIKKKVTQTKISFLDNLAQFTNKNGFLIILQYFYGTIEKGLRVCTTLHSTFKYSVCIKFSWLYALVHTELYYINIGILVSAKKG